MLLGQQHFRYEREIIEYCIIFRHIRPLAVKLSYIGVVRAAHSSATHPTLTGIGDGFYYTDSSRLKRFQPVLASSRDLMNE